jgi:hypothetical protein
MTYKMLSMPASIRQLSAPVIRSYAIVTNHVTIATPIDSIEGMLKEASVPVAVVYLIDDNLPSKSPSHINYVKVLMFSIWNYR